MNLCTLANENKLALNNYKCYYVTCSRSKSNCYYYLINAIPFNKLTPVNDVGITFDCSLSFILHISNITTYAYESLSFLIRNCKDITNPNKLKILYYSIVQPKLQYFSTL